MPSPSTAPRPVPEAAQARGDGLFVMAGFGGAVRCIFWTQRFGLRVGWAGLGWAGLGWAGLGWAGLGWAGTGRESESI